MRYNAAGDETNPDCGYAVSENVREEGKRSLVESFADLESIPRSEKEDLQINFYNDRIKSVSTINDRISLANTNNDRIKFVNTNNNRIKFANTNNNRIKFFNNKSCENQFSGEERALNEVTDRRTKTALSGLTVIKDGRAENTIYT